MEFSSKIKDLFEDGILTADDMAKLAEVRRNAKAAICVSEDEFGKVASEITKEASDWSGETFGAVVRMIDTASEACEGEKIASKGDLPGKLFTGAGRDTMSKLMTMIGVGSLAAIPAARAVEHINRNKSINESWSSLINNNPNIAENPNTAKNWSVLEDFAPDIAANRHAASALIGTMNEYGAVSPKMISDLISMQKGLDEGKPGFGGRLDPIKAVSTVSDLV
jgi:hypothetical protein